MLGIAIGVAAIIAFNAIGKGFKDSLNQYARETGAHLMVLARDVPAAEYSRIKGEDVRAIAGMAEVHQLSGTAFYIGKAKGLPALFVFGRTPGELPIQRYRNKDFRGELLRGDDEVMLGAIAAEKMGVGIGDEIELFGRRKFRVVGIYQVGIPWENVAAVVSTAVIQDEQRMGDSIQMGLVYLKKPRQRDDVKAAIEKRFPHLVALRSEDFASNFENLQYVDWFVWIVSLISILIGGLGVLNTMLMSVSERTREIGTLRAVGWSSARVLRLILSEGTLISLLGGALGLLAGFVGAEVLIRWAPQGYLGTSYTAMLFVQGMAVAVGVGTLGALYPAWRASRLSPIEALKYE
jgi:putative ABC transport system permease protein